MARRYGVVPRSPASGPRDLRRVAVPVPTDVPATAALFLVLRRMRAPLITLVTIVTVSVVALTLAPGTVENGATTRLTLFEAFYVVTYTATTIGFGEIPRAFSIEQRMVVTAAIYLSVAGWAYALGNLLALLQDSGFRRALASQRFRRAVQRLREPFYLLAGYGFAGHAVAQALDERSERLVVVETEPAGLDRLAGDQLHHDVPGLLGDASLPAVLGMAGLASPYCRGVIALTDDEHANLAVAVTAALLRPDLPVVAYCTSADVEAQMADFGTAEVLNPYDAAGDYLVVAVLRPSCYRLVTWLLNPIGSALPQLPQGLGTGRWVVYGDGRFADEVAADLTGGGMTVTRTATGSPLPDLADVEGLMLSAGSDILNLAAGAKARAARSDIFLAMRRHGPAAAALVQAFGPDLIFDPKDLLVREVLARLVAPAFWAFVQHALGQSETWAASVLAQIAARCGDSTPGVARVVVDQTVAPAVHRRLADHDITLADVLRDPSDRDQLLPILPVALVRDGSYTFMPSEDLLLERNDEIVVVGHPDGLAQQYEVLYDDSTLQYAVTGHDVPTSLVWRILTRQPMSGDSDRWQRRSKE